MEAGIGAMYWQFGHVGRDVGSREPQDGHGGGEYSLAFLRVNGMPAL